MGTSITDDVDTQALATRQFIATKWLDASSKANSAFEDALTAIHNIADIGLPAITHPSVNWEDIVADFSFFVTKPTLPNIVFNWPGSKPTMGMLRDYPQFDFPLSNFNSLNNETIAAIRAKLNAGGTGIGAAAEASLWARMRARNDLKNEAAYQDTLNFFSARGFDLPPGALSGRLIQIQSEINRSEVDLNNDITVEQARLTLDNEKFVYELALKTVIDYQKNTIDVISSQNKSVLDVYVSGMEGYKVDVEAEASRVDALGKITVALLDGYKAEVMAESTVVDAKAKEVEARTKLQVAKAEVALKVSEIDIEIAKFVWSIQIEMFKTIATISAQLAASALTSVNASVSSGFSGSAAEQVSGSETYSYDQTKGTRTIHESYNHNYDE